MKSVFKLFLVLLAVFVLFTACPNPGSGGDKPPVIRPGIVGSFFWGSWVRMDGTNEEWYVSDRDIRIGGSTYSVSSADTTSMTLSSYTVTKRTENMLTVSPSSGQEFYLFRKSGATAQVTGGVLGAGSTASGSARSLAGIGSVDVILENQLNLENVIETTTDNDGNLTFDDIITDDTYTLVVPIQPGVEEEITFEVTPEFDGEDIGNININQADQNFKVSYTLSSGDMWGYHYAATSYSLSLKITNIGSADMLSADYAITAPAGLNMSGDSLSHILGTVRANGGVKELSFTFSASSFSEDFKDFEIPISIISVDGTQWDDSISLRIYRETMSIYVASESNEVQGVLISPDKASFPFKTSGHQGSITVPARDTGYVLALSGADYESETSYAMKINGAPLDNGSSNTSARINEPNNDETQATPAYWSHEYLGYLGVYDLDFFSINNKLDTETKRTVTFESMGGSAVDSQSVYVNTLAQAPNAFPARSGFIFTGWYTDTSYTKQWNFSTDTVTADTVLYAKWSAEFGYTIDFETLGGSLVHSVAIPSTGGLIPKPADPVRSGFVFAGWFTDMTYAYEWDFTTSIKTNAKLVAKWMAEGGNAGGSVGAGNLIAGWSFSNVLSDLSANKYDLTNHGAVFTTDRKGNLNSALYFDGVDDYLSLDQSVLSETDINSGLATVSLWAKMDTIDTNGYLFCINGTHTSHIAVRQFRPRIGFQHRDINYANEQGDAYDFPGTTAWMHLAVVLSNGTGTFYLNGVRQGTITGIYISSPAHISIGAEMNRSGSYTTRPEACFKGYMDEIRIYDDALSASEVYALYSE